MSELQLLILFILGLAAIVYFAWAVYNTANKCDRCPFDCAHCPYGDKDFTIEIFERYKDHVREKANDVSSNDGARL